MPRRLGLYICKQTFCLRIVQQIRLKSAGLTTSVANGLDSFLSAFSRFAVVHGYVIPARSQIHGHRPSKSLPCPCNECCVHDFGAFPSD